MPPHVAEPWEDAADPALAYALHHLEWYRRAMRRARFQTRFGDLTILLTTAATVVVSALHEHAAATASLAAVTLFLTGYRQVFNPNERWVSTGLAWMALQQEIARYRLLPEPDRDDAARRALLDRTLEIMADENRSWAEQRRGIPTLPAPGAP